MNKQNPNKDFEDGWNEMAKTFQNQFSAWLKMSEEYFDYMSDSRKKMVADFQKQYGFENDNTKNIFQVAETSPTTAKKEKGTKPRKVLNSDTIEGNWKQLMGDAQKQWSKLTNDNLSQINGSREELAGALQKNYGIARDEAEKQMKDWEKTRAKIVKSATN